MRYLLDTHTLLWIVNDDPQIANQVKKIYLNENNQIFASTASIWEMAIKISLKKLKVPGSLSDFVKEHIRGNKIDIMSIELNHLYQLENLVYFHRDPFDRLLIAQAIAENIPILSKDKTFDDYPIHRIW